MLVATSFVGRSARRLAPLDVLAGAPAATAPERSRRGLRRLTEAGGSHSAAEGWRRQSPPPLHPAAKRDVQEADATNSNSRAFDDSNQEERAGKTRPAGAICRSAQKAHWQLRGRGKIELRCGV